MTMTHGRWILAVWLLPTCLLIGCGGWSKSKVVTTRPEGTLDGTESMVDEGILLAMEGTVGKEVYLEGDRFMRVRGIGLVVGLGNNGSRYCPPSIREHLIRTISLSRRAMIDSDDNRSSDELIDSLDTSVVEVVGEIPAGARTGFIFDVYVTAVNVSPDTKSLVGGKLISTDLHIFREAAPGDVIQGAVNAKCRGPVFINPFAQGAGEVAGTSLVEGRIVGGAVNTEDRRLALKTVLESYALVNQIADAIKRRFPGKEKVAVPESPSHIDLRIPKKFLGHESRFMEIIRHLPLSPLPAQQELRAKLLVELIAEAKLPPEEAALSLEGIGPSATRHVQSLYTHKNMQTNYYAARTGLRLGDRLALDVIARHAGNPRSPFRLQAVRELGNCDMTSHAGVVLIDLLADDDVRVRVLAYEALRAVDPGSMVSVLVGKSSGNFILDIVPAEGEPLIYARRTHTRRIALIAANSMAVLPPLLFSEPGKDVTISAQTNENKVTILRKLDGKIVGRFVIKPDVILLTRFLGDDPKLDRKGKPLGLGLDYSVVLEVLYKLCQDRAINAVVQWEEENLSDWFGPMLPMGRPDSDL